MLPMSTHCVCILHVNCAVCIHIYCTISNLYVNCVYSILYSVHTVSTSCTVCTVCTVYRLHVNCVYAVCDINILWLLPHVYSTVHEHIV